MDSSRACRMGGAGVSSVLIWVQVGRNGLQKRTGRGGAGRGALHQLSKCGLKAPRRAKSVLEYVLVQALQGGREKLSVSGGRL